MEPHAALDLGRIAQDLQIRKVQVENVVHLLDAGNTIPFITRYRKEPTGGLSEETLREISRRVQAQRRLADRKQTILKSIETQGKLTEELERQIRAADSHKRLEDLYLPFKPKKRSLAAAAKEKGLEQLALAILQNDAAVQNLDEIWTTMINPEKELHSVDEVKTGVRQILAEHFAENADARMAVRKVVWETGKLATARHENLADGQGLEYKDYFQFTEAVRQIPAHRILAINRGEKENAIRVTLQFDAEALRQAFLSWLPFDGHPHAEFLRECALEGMEKVLIPSLEREVRRDLTEEAEEHAVQVFSRNLRCLLLQPPIDGCRVLAVDPAFRAGCKLAALDEHGNLLEHGVIYPHPAPNRRTERKGGKRNGNAAASTAHPDRAPASATPTAAANTPYAAAAPDDMPAVLVPLEQHCPATSPPTPAAVADASSTGQMPVEGGGAIAPPAVAAGNGGAGTISNAESTPAAESVAPPANAALQNDGDSGEPGHTVLQSHKRLEAKNKIEELVRKHRISVIAIGNGAASRETEELVAELIAEKLPELSYVIVNEAGASHYSASSVAREEFPDLDAAIRGTISIARRLQDPLSELVKIDPQNIGVGLYQHDLSVKRLRESLEAVVESCVNFVGVDLNAAGPALLRHVSGLNPLSARAIVEYRKQNGPFRTREQLKQVPAVTDAVYTQAAGFLKIVGGDNPLDATWVHPESYPLAERMLQHFGLVPEDLRDAAKRGALRERLNDADVEALAKEWQVGFPTFDDVARSLLHPGRDPREDSSRPIFKKAVLRLEDLKPGMELKGTVLNVVDFGAFVDVGLKDSGLVHISQLANRFIKSPYDVVSVGDVVACWVLSVDHDRRRVSLTMIPPGSTASPPRRPEPRRQGRPRPTTTPAKAPAQQAPAQKPRFASAMVATPESVARKKLQAAQAAAAGGGAGAAGAAESAEAAGDAAAQSSETSAAASTTRPPAGRKTHKPPRRERPPPTLTEEALQGKAPLHTFGELKALYEARKQQ